MKHYKGGLLDFHLENGYLELIPEDPVDNPIKIGDKVVHKNYYFVVAGVHSVELHIFDCTGEYWLPKNIRHCTTDEIAKYFR